MLRLPTSSSSCLSISPLSTVCLRVHPHSLFNTPSLTSPPPPLEPNPSRCWPELLFISSSLFLSTVTSIGVSLVVPPICCFYIACCWIIIIWEILSPSSLYSLLFFYIFHPPLCPCNVDRSMRIMADSSAVIIPPVNSPAQRSRRHYWCVRLCCLRVIIRPIPISSPFSSPFCNTRLHKDAVCRQHNKI